MKFKVYDGKNGFYINLKHFALVFLLRWLGVRIAITLWLIKHSYYFGFELSTIEKWVSIRRYNLKKLKE